MKITTTVRDFTRDNDGGVLVEVTLMLTIMIFFVLGSIDFLFAFYEWNAATKAVQVGARIAAVSNPVLPNLDAYSAVLASTALRPGSAMPSFTVTCDGATATYHCEGTWGRPGGPVPTIKVSLQNIPFRFFFLGFVFNDITIPGLATTITAGDLYSCSPIMRACEDSQHDRQSSAD
jgi:hypothetical protein